MKSKSSALVDINNLTDAEFQHVYNVIDKDLELRELEKKRLQSRNETAEKSSMFGDFINNLKQITYSNNRNCAVCLTHFLPFITKKFLCALCHKNVCQKCVKNYNEGNDIECYTCFKESEIKLKQCSWFYTKMQKRFKETGSIAVLKSISAVNTFHGKGFTRNPLPKTFRNHSNNLNIINGSSPKSRTASPNFSSLSPRCFVVNKNTTNVSISMKSMRRRADSEEYDDDDDSNFESASNGRLSARANHDEEYSEDENGLESGDEGEFGNSEISENNEVLRHMRSVYISKFHEKVRHLLEEVLEQVEICDENEITTKFEGSLASIIGHLAEMLQVTLEGHRIASEETESSDGASEISRTVINELCKIIQFNEEVCVLLSFESLASNSDFCNHEKFIGLARIIIKTILDNYDIQNIIDGQLALTVSQKSSINGKQYRVISPSTSFLFKHKKDKFEDTLNQEKIEMEHNTQHDANEVVDDKSAKGKPKFLTKSDTVVTATLEDEAMLQVEVEGSEPIDLFWYKLEPKNFIPIDPKSNPTKFIIRSQKQARHNNSSSQCDANSSYNTFLHTLIITQITHEDYGGYMVLAVNSGGCTRCFRTVQLSAIS